MTNLIFSGIDKTFFNSLKFSNKETVTWLSIDELVTTGPEVNVSNTKYVMFYCSPEAFLSKFHNEAIDNTAQAEQEWIPQTDLLIQFYLANKANAILVDSSQCELIPEAFENLLKKKFNINCECSEQQIDDADKLMNYSLQLSLLTALTENYDLQSTFENVISAADLLVEDNDNSPESRTAMLRESAKTLVEQIKLTYSNREALVKESDVSLTQVKQLQEELETSTKQQKSSEEQLKQNLVLSKETNDKAAVEKTELETSIAELTAENELSLLQVQQLQEELETIYHVNKTTEEQLKHSQKLSNESSNKLNGEIATVKETNNQLAQAKAKLESSITELTAENELSLLQIQQLQEELESLFVENNQLKQLGNKQAEKELSQKNNNEKNSEQLQDLKTEKEIALLQIQQLQEELEFYFIKYQSLSSNTFISNRTPMNIADKRFEKSLTLSKFLNA